MTDALSEAPTFGIAKILQDGRFVVPDHQRDYSWTVDEVQQLFDDIEDAMSKKSDSYFLGLLVFLTVMFIFSACFCKLRHQCRETRWRMALRADQFLIPSLTNKKSVWML